MFIMIVFVVLALAVIGGLTFAFVTSLILGVVLTKTKTPSLLAAGFLFAIPGAVVGAAVGAVVIGYLAYQANQSAIVLGPLAGLLVGGAAGGGSGAIAGVAWSKRRPPHSPGLSNAGGVHPNLTG